MKFVFFVGTRIEILDPIHRLIIHGLFRNFRVRHRKSFDWRVTIHHGVGYEKVSPRQERARQSACTRNTQKKTIFPASLAFSVTISFVTYCPCSHPYAASVPCFTSQLCDELLELIINIFTGLRVETLRKEGSFRPNNARSERCLHVTAFFFVFLDGLYWKPAKRNYEGRRSDRPKIQA